MLFRRDPTDSFSFDHFDAFLRTNIETKTTPITPAPIDYKFFRTSFSCPEVANRNALPTVRAGVQVGFLDMSPFVAFLVLVLEITAAVITTETDAVGDGRIFRVSEWTGDEMLFLGFVKYTLGKFPGYLVKTSSRTFVELGEYETNIYPRALAALPSLLTLLALSAPAVGNPKPLLPLGHLASLRPGTNIVNGNFTQD
jgi:hypothetical protein